MTEVTWLTRIIRLAGYALCLVAVVAISLSLSSSLSGGGGGGLVTAGLGLNWSLLLHHLRLGSLHLGLGRGGGLGGDDGVAVLLGGVVVGGGGVVDLGVVHWGLHHGLDITVITQ